MRFPGPMRSYDLTRLRASNASVVFRLSSCLRFSVSDGHLGRMGQVRRPLKLSGMPCTDWPCTDWPCVNWPRRCRWQHCGKMLNGARSITWRCSSDTCAFWSRLHSWRVDRSVRYRRQDDAGVPKPSGIRGGCASDGTRRGHLDRLAHARVGLAVAMPASFALYRFQGSLADAQRFIERRFTQLFLRGQPKGDMAR